MTKPKTSSYSDFKIDLDFPAKKNSHLFLSLDKKRPSDRNKSNEKSVRLELILENFANQTKSKQNLLKYNEIPKYSNHLNHTVRHPEESKTVRPMQDSKKVRDKYSSSKGKIF